MKILKSSVGFSNLKQGYNIDKSKKKNDRNHYGTHIRSCCSKTSAKIEVQNNNFRLSSNKGFQFTFKDLENHFKLYFDNFENKFIVHFSSLKMQIIILQALDRNKLPIGY